MVATWQCECGFASNVAELVERHRGDYCAAYPMPVCPGCHAVGEEECRPGCIDAALALESEQAAEIGDDEDADWCDFDYSEDSL